MKIIILAALVSACVAFPNAIRLDDSFSLTRSNGRIGKQVVSNVLSHAPRHSRLIDLRSSGAISTQELRGNLIDNATLIRDNIVGGFDCNGKVYGYYADQNNDCQIFHVCVPLKQIWPHHFEDSDILHFAFICPKYTIFTQDAMVCAWKNEAIPCGSAHELYYLNENFFVIPPKEGEETSKDVQRIKN